MTKMLSTLSSFLGELLGWEETVKDLTKKEEEEILKEYENELNVEENKIEQRDGIITFLGVSFAEIDGSFMFDLEDQVFSVGDTVLFKVETTKSGEKLVFDVKPYRPMKHFQQKSGTICKVENGFFYFEPDNYQFRCIDVKMDFKPIEGDRVTLIGSFDQNFKIESLKATNSKYVTDKITRYDFHEGLIGYDISFRKADCNFDPKLNQEVFCHVIETDRQIAFRAIDVMLSDEKSKGRQTIRIAKIPQFTLSVGETKIVDVNVENCISKRMNIASFHCSLADCDEFKFVLEPVDKYIIPHGFVKYTFECSGIANGRKTNVDLVWNFSSFQVRRVISFKTVSAHKNEPTLVYADRKKLAKPNYPFRRIRSYEMPELIKNMKDQDDLSLRLLIDEKLPYLPQALNPDNYLEKMHALLFIEEIKIIHMTEQLTNEFPIFPVDNETVSFEFDVDSPLNQLTFGDSLYLSSPVGENTEFKGTICLIAAGKFHAKIHHKFMNEFKPRTMYLVRFVKSRACMIRNHFAVDNMKTYDLFHRLFPMPPKEEPSVTAHHVEKWFNESLNMEQKRAVCNILSQKEKEHPYIIYGPPGTGKTMTVVETIMQLVQIESTKIIVVAPTNSAIDIIGVKLLEAGLPKHNMVRLCSYNAYRLGVIAAALEDVSFLPNVLGDGVEFDDEMPRLSQEQLALHKVTLGTVQSISSFCTSNYAQGHFTHLIIDEAGQVTEPDALIPISLLDRENQSQLILAGDPMQLGPIVMSATAKRYGLAESFLKRLSKSVSNYQRQLDKFESTLGYDPRVITKLVINYRSLPKIVKLTSDLFYESHLIPSLDENSNEAKRLSQVKLRNEPLGTKSIIFYNVDGQESSAANSSSFFNQAEVSKIVLVLRDLYLYFRPEEVGIISPYRLQVKTIAERLDFQQMYCPKIGCVEEFQGAEKEVIIFSIVRNREGNSHRKLPDFITDRNKLNVALSRAKVLNIIIGSKRFIHKEPIWSSILDYCE